jgi:GntR family transcriptional regulator, transcriptional repressor for pyruvate dehydrogenase complex
MDRTLEQLKEVITQGLPDEQGRVRLPTERALAQQLDVPRSMLRERLAVLETLGLIARTQGSGTYLALPDSGFVQLYFELALKLGHVTLEQLQAARELLEREVARLAATHATPDDIAALTAAAERLDAANGDAGDEADYAFHRALTAAAHNPALALIMDGLASVLFTMLRQRRAAIRAVPGAAARTNASHAPLIAAIRDGDGERAMYAMDEHFRAWEREAEQLV